MKQRILADETDAALDDAARRYAKNRYSFEQRRKLDWASRRFTKEAWAELAEMGWLAVAIPEDDGGLGLRVSSIAVLAEVAGRMMLAEPLISTGFTGAALIARLGSAEQRELYLPKIVGGELRLAVAADSRHVLRAATGTTKSAADSHLSGRLEVVLDADIAELLLVKAMDPAGHDRIYVVEPGSPGVSIQAYPLSDGRGAATVSFEATRAVRLGRADVQQRQAIIDANLLGALAVAADSLGTMSVALEMTLDYLKTRSQFGRPIGTNQTLQFRAVDMYILQCEASAVVAAAVDVFSSEPAAFARHVHAAKAIVGNAARRVTQEAIQLHGGIGITDEYIVSHCLRRAMVNEQLYGNTADHVDGFAIENTDVLNQLSGAKT